MFEPGNQLALGRKQPKIVQDTIKRAIIQDDAKMLRQAVDAQLQAAADGDLAALMFIRDTIEGKPAQAISVEDSDGLASFTSIRLIVVDHTIPNGNNALPAIEVKPSEV